MYGKRSNHADTEKKKKQKNASNSADVGEETYRHGSGHVGPVNRLAVNDGPAASTSAVQDPQSAITDNNDKECGNFDETDTTNRLDQLYAHPQDRGNPFLGECSISLKSILHHTFVSLKVPHAHCFSGWIPWTLHLSYEKMLRGIPGTGTRNGGMKGKLLAVNFDAIVLFRFHGTITWMCLIVFDWPWLSSF